MMASTSPATANEPTSSTDEFLVAPSNAASAGFVAVSIEQGHTVARQGPAHRARHDRLARRIADLRRGLGLAVAVADGEAPGLLNLVDDLGIERLAGAADLAQAHLERRKVLLDEQPPHRRRRA